MMTDVPEMIQEATDQFLGIEASSGPRGSLEDSVGESKKKGKKGKKKGARGHQQKPRLGPTKSLPAATVSVPAREAGELAGKAGARKVSSGFPVDPMRLPSGAFYVESNPVASTPKIHALTTSRTSMESRHGAYRMVVEWPQSDGIHYWPAGHPGLVGPAYPRQPEPRRRPSTAASTTFMSMGIACR